VRRPSWTLFWVFVIAGLVLVELAEVTRVFALPVQTAALNVVGVLFAIVLVTILALVGAVFIGIYVTQRMLTPQGFSPFEEEMLRMRADVAELKREIQALRGVEGTAGPYPPPPPPEEPTSAGGSRAPRRVEVEG
jgi:hypothetical protein